MTRLLTLAVMLAVSLSFPVSAKDKDSSVNKAIKRELSGNDHPGKGKGQPDNPGEHGRDNAAEKQSRGQGNGSKQQNNWYDGDSKKKNKDKDKDKNSEKNKKSKK
jgi:hypothetical protein